MSIDNKAGTDLRGLIYIKSRKTASSTLSGINLRIAHRKSPTNSTKICANTFKHRTATSFKVRERIKEKTFLWTFVRNPSSQFLSQFFHFQVSRLGIEPTIQNLKLYADHEYRISSRTQLGVINAYKKVKDGNDTKIAERILKEYDFIGLVERFDESLVVLRLLLGLDAGDILYLSAKIGGAYDGGGYNNSCTHIQPSVKTPEIEEYFNSAQWYKMNKALFILHKAINLSLDRTIESIGTSIFENALKEHRHLMSIVTHECALKASFPCSKEGVLQTHLSDENCYRKDAGCGYPCIDQLYDDLMAKKHSLI